MINRTPPETAIRTAILAAAAALAMLAILPAGAEAGHRHHRVHVGGQVYAYDPCACEIVARPARRSRVVETHDTVRANQADPTHQYKLPDWARAAFDTRGRR